MVWFARMLSRIYFKFQLTLKSPRILLVYLVLKWNSILCFPSFYLFNIWSDFANTLVSTLIRTWMILAIADVNVMRLTMWISTSVKTLFFSKGCYTKMTFFCAIFNRTYMRFMRFIYIYITNITTKFANL